MNYTSINAVMVFNWVKVDVSLGTKGREGNLLIRQRSEIKEKVGNIRLSRVGWSAVT